ncbi:MULTISPECIES: formimidoylglutamate deiminase [unclassified Salinibacterium]|uniref:formimidoylglutamate deiminase n=1 Tax=unclassified Salinibacterium TaxID=2632331 RepID=UPI001F11497B|nr:MULTISPECIES: formimidoylglutamate deiminase [unclassified Salinibacterium]
MILHCQTALIDGVAVPDVRIHSSADGRIAAIERGTPPREGDARLGLVMPGAGNAHSHAFHRALRGRTHDKGGDFWRWRDSMYAAAARLDPETYHELALGVFGEMLTSGWTAVGEFHYVHHRPDGSGWPRPHAMELALAEAASRVGIRLTLLDTCYLAGGIGQPLAPAQFAFTDGSADAWLARWWRLRDALPDGVVLGAAIHSVRGVPRDAIAEIVRSVPADVPLHIHLSEQPQENADCLREHGVTPTGLLAQLDALSPRLSVVHATHLSDNDVRMLGEAGVTVVMCPTTEADLGDGIGPALRLAGAGATIALGSDQNAVVDPLLEARGLEAGERLASGLRGRFTPAVLLDALSVAGYGALGLQGGLREGAHCDLVELDGNSVRTIGSESAQLALSATASDVMRVIVGGEIVADRGRLVLSAETSADPVSLLSRGLRRLDEPAAIETPSEDAP